MGKKIDGFMLSLAVCAAFYFYFYRSFQNHAFALAAALLCGMIMRKTIFRILGFIRGRQWYMRRAMRRNAGASMLRLACMPEDEAQKALSRLMKQEYRSEYPLEFIPIHPSTNAEKNRIFEAWKRHRGEDKLVVCTSGRCDAECRALAAELRAPRLALVDSGALAALIAAHPEDLFTAEKPARRHLPRLKSILFLTFNRRNAPRCLLLSLAMLGLYALNSSTSYLVCALLLIFVVLVSFSRPSKPVKLF